MATEGGFKVLTFTNVQPGATVHGWWNNANSEVYRLNAWPKVAPGVTASAEITNVRSSVHGSPSERELHFDVKNTGATAIDIDVWGFRWDWSLKAVLEAIRAQFSVPAVGGAIVTRQGIKVLDVAGIRLQPLVVSGSDPVTEDVHRLWLTGEAGGQLLGDEAVGTVGQLQATVDRVVIGDRHEVHAPSLGELVDLLRGRRALGQPETSLDAQPGRL